MDRFKRSVGQLFAKKTVRFLVCGAITAAFNIALIALLIDSFSIETAYLRNVANIVAIKVSLIFSFLVYRVWVWKIKTWNIRNIFLHQIPKFHAASSLVILTRTLIIFPILDWLGVSSVINTCLGIAAGAAVNYFFNDRIVFTAKK